MSLNERLQIVIDADARGASREMQRFGATTERELGKTEDSLKRMSGQLTTFGVAAVATGGVAAAGLFKLAKAADDSAQALNKSNVILGEEGTRALNAYAQAAAQTAGISQTAALEAGAQFGLFAQSAGFAGEAAGEFSAEMVQLAGDLSSIANVDTEQSLNALQAAFAGQTRPLRQLGIFLDDYTLKQRLAAETGEQVTGTLTTQQRALAVYLELLDQGEKFSGDFANTSDTLANRQRQLSAEFDNLQSNLGRTLLPAFEAAIGGLQGLVGGFQRLPEGVQAATVGFAGVASAGALAAGGLALVVGQGIKAVQTFGELSARLRDSGGALSLLGRAAPGIGIAAAAGVGLLGLKAALDQLSNTTSQLEDAFDRLANAATSAEFRQATNDAIDAAAQYAIWETSLDNVTGAMSRTKAEQEVFNELLERSTTLAEDFVNTIETGGDYVLVPEGQTADLSLAGEKIQIAAERIDEWRAAIEAKRESDIQAAFAQRQYNQEVADGVAELEAVEDVTTQAARSAELDEKMKARAERATNRLTRQLNRLNAVQQLTSLNFDATATRAAAFSTALERATSATAVLTSGVAAGRALSNLRRGLGGVTEESQVTERTVDRTGSAVNALTRAASESDPALSRMGIALGSVGAAASAFGQALLSASGLGTRLDSALSLSTAFDDFRRTFRRLPADIDVTSVSLGRLRPRQRDAIRNLIQLGQASRSYLQTLIETGGTHDDVRSEAERLRREYVEQFRQMGLNEEQINRYLEVLGLTPEQITTALNVAGLESARFRVNAYLQLLQGKIPDEVATTIIPLIEADRLDEAAAALAGFAASNPAVIDVEPQGVPELKQAERTLWDLPKRYDAVAAATGKYSDAQLDALDGVLQLGQAARDYLETLLASGASTDTVEAEAARLREAYAGVFRSVGITGDALNEYYRLLGIAPDQVSTAIRVSGLEENIFKIQTYLAILENLDELSPQTQLDVAAALSRDDYDAAVAILEAEVLEATVDADTEPARREYSAFQRSVLESPANSRIEGDTDPAWREYEAFRTSVLQAPANASVDLETDVARTRWDRVREAIEARGLRIPVSFEALQQSIMEAPANRSNPFSGRRRAMGGRIWDGWWLAGEHGPELVRMGAGQGTVSSANETRRMLSTPPEMSTDRELLRELKALNATISSLDAGGMALSEGAIQIRSESREPVGNSLIRALRTANWLMQEDRGR